MERRSKDDSNYDARLSPFSVVGQQLRLQDIYSRVWSADWSAKPFVDSLVNEREGREDGAKKMMIRRLFFDPELDSG
jgi:hypothetical protein